MKTVQVHLIIWTTLLAAILLTLSGRGGGGGSEARMTKLTAANQKLFTL